MGETTASNLSKKSWSSDSDKKVNCLGKTGWDGLCQRGSAPGFTGRPSSECVAHFPATGSSQGAAS